MCLPLTAQVPRVTTCHLLAYVQPPVIREKSKKTKNKNKKNPNPKPTDKKPSPLSPKQTPQTPPGTELDEMNMFKMVGDSWASSCGIGAHFLAFTINFGTTCNANSLIARGEGKASQGRRTCALFFPLWLLIFSKLKVDKLYLFCNLTASKKFTGSEILKFLH